MEIDCAVANQLLTHTRSVRRSLDVSQPVNLAVVRECLTIAQQAPASGGVVQRWIVITDRKIRTSLRAG